MMAVEMHLEDALFIPPDGFVGVGKDDHIAESGKQCGRCFMQAEKVLGQEVLRAVDLGSSRQMLLQDSNGFIHIFIANVEEHIAGRSGWHQRATTGVCLQIALDPRYLLIEVEGGLGVDLKLTVIGDQHKECIASLLTHRLIEELIYLSEAVIDHAFEVLRTWSVVVAEGINATEVEEIIAGCCVGRNQLSQKRECLVKMFIWMNSRAVQNDI